MITTFYSRYSTQTIFDDPQLNVFFNQLHTFLINNLDETLVLTELMLDGKVSLLLQDEPVENLTHIDLTTGSRKIIELLQRSATSLAITDYTFTHDQVVLRFGKYIIHVNYTDQETEKISFNGVTIRDKSQIEN